MIFNYSIDYVYLKIELRLNFEFDLNFNVEVEFTTENSALMSLQYQIVTHYLFQDQLLKSFTSYTGFWYLPVPIIVNIKRTHAGTLVSKKIIFFFQFFTLKMSVGVFVKRCLNPLEDYMNEALFRLVCPKSSFAR